MLSSPLSDADGPTGSDADFTVCVTPLGSDRVLSRDLEPRHPTWSCCSSSRAVVSEYEPHLIPVQSSCTQESRQFFLSYSSRCSQRLSSAEPKRGTVPGLREALPSPRITRPPTWWASADEKKKVISYSIEELRKKTHTQKKEKGKGKTGENQCLRIRVRKAGSTEEMDPST